MINPIGGSTYSPSNRVMTFRINAEGSKMLNGRSIQLRAKHVVDPYPDVGVNPDYCILQDGGLNAVINQIKVTFGGQDIELIRQWNLMHNALFYHSSSLDFARRQGWFQGYYLDDITNQSGISSITPLNTLTANLSGATTPVGNPPVATAVPLAQFADAEASAIPANTTAPIVGNASAVVLGDPMTPIKNRGKDGWVYSIPLSLVAITRCQRFIPLQLFQFIQLDITLEDFAKCHYVYNPTGAISFTNCSYKLSDVALCYRLVQPNELIAEQLTQLALSEMGFAMVFNGHDCVSVPVTLASSIRPNVTINKSKVKSLWIVSQKQEDTTKTTERALSKYYYDNMKSYQIYIGANPLSTYRIGDVSDSGVNANGACEMFSQLEQSLGQWNGHDGFGLVSGFNYTTDEPLNGVTLPQRFMIGADLETASNCLTGLNLKSGSPFVFLDANYYTNPAANSNRSFTFMYSYDYVVVVAGSAITLKD